MEKFNDMDAIRGKVEDVAANIGSVKSLVSAMEDKVRFYLLDKNMYGPFQGVVQYHAMEIQALLGITEGILNDMEQTQDQVVDVLYGVKEGRRAGCRN